MAETRKKTGKTVVVALGGNAILQPGQVGTFEEQLFNVDGAMRRIAELVESGWRVVLTHGNGPQVGNLLIQNALAAKTVAPMPMDVCGAESQGQIGYMLEQTLQNHLRMRRLEVPVVTVLTQVAVSANDKAFAAALLAKEVAADALLILTDVPQVYIHYNTPVQQALGTVTLAEMQAYAAEGHFKAGSMGPKVAACMRFVAAGGTAIIASLTEVVQAMAGDAGTRIVPEAGTGKKTERAAGHAAKKSAGKTRGKKADSKKAPPK